MTSDCQLLLELGGLQTPRMAWLQAIHIRNVIDYGWQGLGSLLGIVGVVFGEEIWREGRPRDRCSNGRTISESAGRIFHSESNQASVEGNSHTHRVRKRQTQPNSPPVPSKQIHRSHRPQIHYRNH